MNKSSCPAKSIACNNYKKVGHYGKVCKSRKVNTVDQNEEVEVTRDEETSQLFIGSVSEQRTCDASWVQKCVLDSNLTVLFTLDRGAQANILPLDVFRKLSISKKKGMLKFSLS